MPRVLKQWAVWWRNTGFDLHGQATFATALQIRCRWDDESVEFLDRNGETKISNAQVLVDRDLKVGDRLWLSSLTASDADVLADDPDVPASATEDREDQSKVFEILAWQKNPNFKGKKFVRTAIL